LQVLDTEFTAPLRGPSAFPKGDGPMVWIDEAHHNFHTAGGRYRPFARLLEADGFRVRANREAFDRATLAQVRVLVIANAFNAPYDQRSNWSLPAVSAFAPAEIAAIVAWVRGGGSLLLIADHMPFPGAVTALGDALGIYYANGFALLGEEDPRTGDYPIVFRRSDGTLASNPITNGRTPAERVDSIESFTGSVLHFDNAASFGIMRLPRHTRLMLPVVEWRFSDSTVMFAGDGLLQGGAIQVGRGRVAAFAEAGMFTAQRKGADRLPMGMNAPAASENSQFILNVLHWLVHVTN
jgi:hypothetical protein